MPTGAARPAGHGQDCRQEGYKASPDHGDFSAEAAIDLANDTEYGLTGGVISRDLDAALEVASRVQSGIIHINDQGIGDEPMAPFGGVKNTDYGRFGGTAGIESFTEQRWVTIQHSGRPSYPF